jgi:membrane fusion protein, multidrug efflux system
MKRWSLAATATVAALMAGCGEKQAPPDPVRPVVLQQVRIGAPNETSVFAGEVKPRREADLAFRVGGKLIARTVDVGARVRKGQVLARLDPADVALQAEAAKAQVAAAETELRFAKAEFERFQNLFAQKFVSESALDQKRNAYETNRAKLEQARAQLAVAQNQAGYSTLSAPDDGVIVAITAEAGQVVGAGQSVMRLAREEEREIAISVPENRIDEVTSAPMLAVVLLADPQKLYAAKVREVAPAVDPTTRTFAVRVAVPDADRRMQWGMTANVAVRRVGGGQSGTIPLTAIYRKDGNPAVWVYDPDTHKVALRPVTVAQFREDGAVVSAGLADGEWIVGAGVHKLQPGQVVRPYEAPGAESPSSAAAQAAPVAAKP